MGLGIVTAVGLLPQAQGANNANIYKQFDLFSDAYEKVRENYVRPVQDTELMSGAIEGMVAGLDPHSSYMDAKAYQDMQVQTKGEFGGLGIEVTEEDGEIKVVTPIDDTPAAKAGIQANDLIFALDGDWSSFTPVERATFTVARKLATTPVVLTDADTDEAVKQIGPRLVVQLISYVTNRASFDRINGILEQSTLKELCIMMNDNIMLVNISKFFADKRYILWLSPGSQQAGGTLVERQINQLRQYVEERAMQSDNATNRQVNFINEKLNEVHTLVEKMSEPNEDQIERENNIEQQLTDLVNSNTKMNEVVDKLFAKMSPADAVEDVAKDVKKKAKSYFSSGFASLKNAVKDTVKDVDNLATAALTASASTVKKPEEDDSMFKQTYVSMA